MLNKSFQQNIEGHKDYFGKKCMNVHIDAVLTKQFSEIVKHVYYTVVYRCEQSLEDTVCISENVLKEIVKDLPGVTNYEIDNASCYHGNYSAEVNHLYVNMKLLRYNFNEPHKGKNQCNCEAAPAKNQLRAYVEAGNDNQSAEDCVAEIDTEKTNVRLIKLNVSAFHSILYEEEGMQVGRYYAVGEVIVKDYSHLESGLNIKMLFHSTATIPITSIPKSSEKIREDRKLCTLYFCPTIGWKGAFEKKQDYDVHVLHGNHKIVKECGAMDMVRKSFIKNEILT